MNRTFSIAFRPTDSSALRLPHLFLIACLTVLLASCETDSYEKGEGEYSLMQASLAELYTDGSARGVRLLTDEGSQLTLESPVQTQWMQTSDSLYRVVAYYSERTAGTVRLDGLTLVPTLLPIEHWRFKQTPEDPVGFESAWLSLGGKYLNVGLLLKSGRIDDEEGSHGIALACDTVLTNADQTRTAYYRLLHSQGDTPQYYTNRRYISILLPADERPDSVVVSLPTDEGPLTRRFAL